MVATTGKTSAQDPLEYLSKGWFPVNTVLLKDIQKKFKEGAYNEDRDGLVRDIKSDFALFGHCLKTMGTTVVVGDRARNPLDLLHQAEIKNLQALIEVPTDSISAHSFDPHVRHQVARIKHFIISCSTAEIIGVKQGISIDLAYSCAFARQLGMTLIAFNYPRIYSQAVTSLKNEEDDLDRILKKVLGYSPTQIGSRAVFGWSRYAPLRQALGESTPATEEGDPIAAFRERDASQREGEVLKEICELGEALARLNDVEHYPGSAKQWDMVVSEVRNYLGADGMNQIIARVREQQSSYVTLSPDAFRTEISQEQNVKAANAQYVRQLLAGNNYLKSLSAALHEEFEKLYQHIKREQVSTEGLNYLVSRLVPQLGFVRGCIYLTDAKRMKLVPTVRIGSAELGSFRAFSLGDMAYTNPIIDALNSVTPIRQENVVFNDEVISHISGTFGTRDKGGVLHLQMGREIAAADRSLSLLYFKAVRQALNDCLDLR